MVAQYVVVAPKVDNINSGWLSSGKLVAPKEDNIHYRAAPEPAVYEKPADISGMSCPSPFPITGFA